MRRYAVRFLVAILTFGIGVTLSLLLGLFKPQEIMMGQTWSRSSCSKSFRYVGPQLVTVHNNSEGPLKLVYRGTNFERAQSGVLVSVENTSSKRVSDYLISGEKSYETSGRTSHKFMDRNFTQALDPGESRLITLPLNFDGMALYVTRITFEDGSVWSNPRGTN